MTSTHTAIDIHRASPEERLAAYRNVHEVWGGDTPIDDYVQRRLDSPQHNRADWWVLTVDNEVVSSLGCYPLMFARGGDDHPDDDDHTKPVSGFGFGAVHTRPEHRRRGYADRLCREVIRIHKEAGDRFALLYSDIDTAYYAQMGFVRVPMKRWRASDLHTLAHSGPVARLKSIPEPERRIRSLSAAYTAHHTQDPLYLHRDTAYWRYSLTANPEDLFLSVDRNRGYIRAVVSPKHNGIYLVELALKDPDRDAAALRGLARFGIDLRAIHFISGWVRPPKALRHTLFSPTPLQKAIPMLLALHDDLSPEQLAACRIWASDHF